MERSIRHKTSKLVDIDRLIDILFEPECRPSKRFLMSQKAAGNLPFIKIGRRVFYDPVEVQQHLFSSREGRAA
jgi:hypothetical protein